jgi:hypothetical protein
MAGCFEEMLIFPQIMGTRIKKKRVYKPNSIWPHKPSFLDGIKILRAGFLDHQKNPRPNLPSSLYMMAVMDGVMIYLPKLKSKCNRFRGPRKFIFGFHWLPTSFPQY